MSAHKRPYELAQAGYEVPDPGTGTAINYNKWGMVVPFTIAASATETNTLAAPLNANQRLILFAQVVGASGTRTVTAASALNSDGDLTLVFNAVDDIAVLTSVPVGSGVFEWRVEYSEGVTGAAGQDLIVDDLTAAGTFTLGTSVFDSDVLAGQALAGFTGGTGTIYKTAVTRKGGLYVTEVLFDLTGLGSSTTDLDVIGQGAAAAAYVCKLTAAECGTTILTVELKCLEAPATGVSDLDLYSAVEGTAKFDDGIAALTETALITAGGAWTNGLIKAATTVPLSTEYIYLTCGAAGTVGTFTAGKFLLTIIGY